MQRIIAQTTHTRFAPTEHSFSYPVYYWALPLSELGEIKKSIPFAAHNSFSLFSVYNSDYLEPTDEPIAEKLKRQLPTALAKQVTAITLVTTPRFLGHVFNPVSFFYCYDSAAHLVCIAFEIHNTFSERCLYVMPTNAEGRVAAKTNKRFYVSPFNSADGIYDCSFAPLNGKLEASFSVSKKETPFFNAAVAGTVETVSKYQLLLDALRFGPRILLTLPLILWKAATMYYRHNLQVQTKPNPTPPLVYSTATPSYFQLLALRLVERTLEKLSHGALKITYPNGTTKQFGKPPVSAAIEVYDYRFFTQLLLRGDIGLGEQYTAGTYTVDNLTAFLRLLVQNREALSHGDAGLAKIGKYYYRLSHMVRRNSLGGSKKNISAHYDLSNELFQLFLDPSLTYSSAVFKTAQESLEQAQYNKLDMILDKARIKAQHHLLEIGSGWGSCAIRAVERTGCRVTTITLSEEQKREAEARINARGLQDKITVLLCDYRKVTGTFDRIISIEMLEAVGHHYYGSFFETIEQRLRPDGIAVLQVITLPDQRFEEAKRGDDWIQQYIFPGSTIPSLHALTQAMKDYSTLCIDSVENIGPHYATTLAYWREKFLGEKRKILDLGFTAEFTRAWEYYFSYCEAGFRERVLSDLQLVLTRPNNTTLIQEDCIL